MRKTCWTIVQTCSILGILLLGSFFLPPIVQMTCFLGSSGKRIVLTDFRARTDVVQENRVHSITLEAHKAPNLDFEPIPS